MNEIIKLSIFAKARAGKSSAAKYLAQHHRFNVLSFGAKVKQYYHEIFGETIGKDRSGYQWFGQMMRRRDPDVWIKQVHPLVLRSIEKGWNIVFDDMRQPNEYQFLKSLGFVMVRIDCPDEIRLERMREAGDILPDDPAELDRVLNHETERYIDLFEPDVVINNTGTPSQLYDALENIISQIKKGA